MAVRIYGKSYHGLDGAEALVKMEQALFPFKHGLDTTKRHEKLEVPKYVPQNVSSKKKGESSVIEWLRHRNEHARSRVARGLPARVPDNRDVKMDPPPPEQNDDDMSDISDDR